VLFLTGKGKLTRDFTVSFDQGGTPDTYALRLQPKLPQRDYDWLRLVVDRGSLQLRELTAVNAQGTQTFRFSNFKENVGLSDKTFGFTIPRGADVIFAGSSSGRYSHRLVAGTERLRRGSGVVRLRDDQRAPCRPESGARIGFRPRGRRVHQGGPRES